MVISLINHENKYIALVSEFTAMMITLSSCLDILAHCINTKTNYSFNANINSNRIYFSTIPEKMLNTQLAIKVAELKKLSQYLLDFVNVSKHRNVISLSSEWAFLSANMVIRYYVIDAFTKNKRSYPSKVLSDVANDYYKELMAKISDIHTLVSEII